MHVYLQIFIKICRFILSFLLLAGNKLDVDNAFKMRVINIHEIWYFCFFDYEYLKKLYIIEISWNLGVWNTFKLAYLLFHYHVFLSILLYFFFSCQVHNYLSLQRYGDKNKYICFVAEFIISHILCIISHAVNHQGLQLYIWNNYTCIYEDHGY